MEREKQEALKFDEWAVVELFGHQKIAGRVTEQNIAGASMLRVDVPAIGDQPSFTKFYGGSAIYALTPCTEELARATAAYLRKEPISRYEIAALPAGAPMPTENDDLDF